MAVFVLEFPFCPYPEELHSVSRAGVSPTVPNRRRRAFRENRRALRDHELAEAIQILVTGSKLVAVAVPSMTERVK
jgi:hypothetical protein